MYPNNGGNGKPDALDRLVRQDIIETQKARKVDEHVSDIDWMELGDIAEKKQKNVAFTTSSDIRNERAANQGVFLGLANGVLQTVKAAPWRVLAAAGEMLDIPDYFNGSDFDKTFGDGADEYGNFFSNWIRENVISSIEKNNAVYKYDDVSLLGTSPMDARWWQNFSADLTSIAGSATEFAGAGFGVGGLISKGLRTAGMIGKLGKTLNGQSVMTGLERLLTATATNQAEALGSAADVHQRLYEKAIAEGETMGEAEKKASIGAATAMNINRANIALNLTSVGVFGMGGFGTRSLTDAGKLMSREGAKKMAMEGGQEFLEEVNNFAAEKIGEQAAKDGREIGFLEATFGPEAYAKRMDAVKKNPQQALEAGILGALGGIGQTTMNTALASDAVLNGLTRVTGGRESGLGRWVGKTFGKEVVVFDENGNPKEKPRGEDGSFQGYETEIVSKNEANRRRHDRQEKLTREYERIFGKENADKMWDTFQSFETQKDLIDQMNQAKKNNDTTKYNQLRETMLQERAYEAFETGTAGVLLGAMQSELHRNISEQEAIDRGLPSDYKKNLQEGIDMVRELEKEYIESKLYKDSHLIYNTKASMLRAKNYKSKAKQKFDSMKDDFNGLVFEAMLDKKLDSNKRWTRSDKKEGKTSTGGTKVDTIVSERTMEDLSAGDYASILSGDTEVDSQDAQAVMEFFEEVNKLFPAEIQAMGEVAAEIEENKELEYIYRNLNNQLRSPEYQANVAKAEEQKIVEDAKAQEEEQKQQELDAQKKKQNAAREEVKEKLAVVDAVAEIAAAVNEDLNPDMDTPVETEDDIEYVGGEDLEGGYDPDTDNNEVGGVADFRSKSASKRKALNLKRPNAVPTNEKMQGKSEKNPKKKDSEAKEEIKKNILNKMKTIIDGQMSNQDPGSKKTKINLDDEAFRELIALNRQLIEDYLEGKEPTWKDMLTMYKDEFGESWARRAYPYIVNVFGFTTGQQIITDYDGTMNPSLNEAADLHDIHAKFEEEIGEDTYTVDTQDKQTDRAEAQVLDITEFTHQSKEYDEDNEDGNKTLTGFNILAYLAIRPEMDNTSPEQKRKEIFDNMLNPMIMSTKHFNPGTEILVEPANDDTLLVRNRFRRGKQTTYAQFKLDAAAKYGEDTDLYNATILEETPMVFTDSDGNPIGHVHGKSWITRDKVSERVMELPEQRKELMEFRAAVMKANVAGTKYRTEIKKKLPGKLMYQRNKQGDLVPMDASVALPAKNLQLTVKTNSGFVYGEAEPQYETMSDENDAVLGGVFAMVTVPSHGTTKTIASPLMPNLLSEDIVNGIEQAINAFMDTTGEYADIIKQLNDTAGIDLTTIDGVEEYLKQFIYTLSHNKTKTVGGANAQSRFMNYTNSNMTSDDKLYVQRIGNAIYIARGAGYPITDADNSPLMITITKKSKNWGADSSLLKEALRKHTYTKVSREGINSKEVGLWAITDNGIANLAPEGDYNQFVKNNSTSYVSSVNLGDDTNPDYIYTVQSIVEVDTNADQGAAPKKKEAATTPETTTQFPIQKGDSVATQLAKKKVNGEAWSFADIQAFEKLKSGEVSKEIIKLIGEERAKSEFQAGTAYFGLSQADIETKEKGNFEATWKYFTKKFKVKGIKGIKKGEFLKHAADKALAKEMWNKLKARGIIKTNAKGWAIGFVEFTEGEVKKETSTTSDAANVLEQPVKEKTDLDKLVEADDFVKNAKIEEALNFLESSKDHQDSPGIAEERQKYITILQALGMDVTKQDAVTEETSTLEDITSETTEEIVEAGEEYDDFDIDFFNDMDLSDKGQGNYDPRMLSAEERTDIGESLYEILIPELGAIRQKEVVDSIVSNIISSVFETKEETKSTDFVNQEVDRAQSVVDKSKKHIARLEAAQAKGITHIKGADINKLLIKARSAERLFGAVVDNRDKIDSMVTIKMQKMKDIKVNQKEAATSKVDGTSSLEKDQLDENASFTTDSKKTVGANVRRFLANLVDTKWHPAGGYVPQTTWTGALKIVPFDEVFNTLSAVLEGVKPEYDTVIAALKAESKVHGWMHDLVQKLEAASKDKDLSIVNEFMVAMSKHQIKMKFVFWTYDEGKKRYTAKVTDSNQGALAKAIQNSWYDNMLRSGLVVDYNGVKKLKVSEKERLLKEFEAIRDYSMEQKGNIGFEDIRYWYADNPLSEVGDSMFLDKVPAKNALHKEGNLPAVVHQNNLVLKVEKIKDGRISITKLAADQAPEAVVKRAMLAEWLGNLGIKVDGRVLSDLEVNGIRLPGEQSTISLKQWLNPNNKSENNPFYHIYKSLKNDKISDGDINSNRSMFIHKGIKALAGMQAKYERKVFSNSFQSGKKTVYTYTANKYATDRLRSLKTDPKLIETLAKLDFSKASLWLKDFVTKDGKARMGNPDHMMEIGYVSLQAIKQKGAKNRDDKSLLDVSPADHEWYKMAMFFDMKEGKDSDGKRIVSYLYPTVPAEKSARFVVKNKAYKTKFNKNGLSKTVVDTFYQHVFMAEYKRIIKHQKTGKIGQKEYDSGAELFHFLPKLNATPELWGVDGKILDVSDAAIKEKVKKVIAETLKDAVEAKVAQWERFGFTKGEEGKKRLKYVDHEYVADIKARKPDSMDEVTAAAYDYEVNQMLATVNMFQMFVGDPAVFHKEKAATKAINPILQKHLAIQEWMKAEGDNVANYAKEAEANKKDSDSKWNTFSNLSKRMQKKYMDRADAKMNGTKDTKTKKGLPAMTKHQKMLELAKYDSNLANQYANEMIKEVFTNVGKRLAADVAPGHDLPNTDGEKIKYLFVNDRESKSINYEFLESLALKGVGDYKKVEGTDAQEYTTWQQHLDVLLKLGKISQNKHDMMADKIRRGEPLNDNLLKEVLQPIKPVYTGNVADVSKGFERRMYIKSSSFPLLPQLTKGLEIDKLRQLIENPKNKIDRVAFKSATKVGMPSDIVNLYDEQGNMNTEFTAEQLAASTLELPRSNFRIQMEVPYKESKKAINVGTQERKLMFTNIRDIDGFKVPGNDNATGKELEEEYNKLYWKLFKTKYEKLKKRLVDPVTGDLNKRELEKLLKEEAAGRGYPLADLLGLDTVVNNEGGRDFIIPLWANPSHKAFESLMISLVQNNINKMKFNGGSFVTGSEEGFKVFRAEAETQEEYDQKVKDYVKQYDGHMAWTKNWQGQLHPGGEYWATADKSKRYTQSQYDALEDSDFKAGLTKQILPTQVLMPSKIRGHDGHLIDMRRFVNPNTGVIDQNKIPKELLEYFQFRIPTQGHNSMSWSEIVGFLPPESGDLLIVPRDLTIQKGLDFDVDKEYAYFYHMKEVYDKNDANVSKAKADYMEAIEKHLGKDLINKLNDLKAKTKANPWVERKFKGEMLLPIIKKNLSSDLIQMVDAMSEQQLYDLHQSGYQNHYGDYTPLTTKYKGNTLVKMKKIKKAVQIANQVYNDLIKNPHKELKATRLAIQEAKADGKLQPYKDAIQDAKDSATKMKKVGGENDSLWVHVEGNTLNAEGEPIKVRVETNNEGEILNMDELTQSGMIEELQQVFPENVSEGFKNFADKIVQEKRVMNQILDIHKQIMLNPKVQKYIYEPLAFGDLKGNADIAQKIFDAMNIRNVNNKTFTPMSSEFQRDKLTSGLAGRVGIGTFSLDSVFLSQLQGKGVVINESYIGNDGKQVVEPIYLRFGDVETDRKGDVSGVKLNRRKGKKPPTSTRFDTIAAFQSAAVDNEKEQILDKINANKHTFDAIRTMAMFGFDEKLISVFLTQDSIIHYVDQMNLSESEVTKAFGKVDFDTIVDEYEAKHKITWGEGELDRKGYPKVIDDLGFDELWNKIENGGESAAYYKQQAGILRKFKYISKIGSVQLKKLQGVLKADSSGFGGNFLEISDKYDKFTEVLGSPLYTNADKMVGDVVSNAGNVLSSARIVELEKAGYVPVGKSWKHAAYYIKPTTIMGQSLVYGLQTANRMFKDIIPYSKIKNALNEIQKLNNQAFTEPDPISTTQLVEMFDDLKSFIFTHDNSNVIVSERFQDSQYAKFNTISGVRNRLLKDVKDSAGNVSHSSLATIINTLANSADTNIIQNNPFLSRLTTREAGEINLVEFNAAVDRGFDDTALYAGMADLLSDKIELPPIDGKPYNTTQLAQDLITYSYTMGGVQGATNFMRYVPIHYLTQLGFDKGTRNIMKTLVKGDGKPTALLWRFYDQYIQNNPDKAKVMRMFDSIGEAEGKTGLVKRSKKIGKTRMWYYTAQKDGVPQFVGKYISVKADQPSGYKLFVWNKDMEWYVPMGTAGTAQMKEYDAMNSRKFGINTIIEKWKGMTVAGRKSMKNISPNDRSSQGRWNNYGTEEQYKERHTSYLEYVKNNTTDNNLNLLADFFLTKTDELKSTAILVDNNLPGRASHNPVTNEMRFNEWEMSKNSKYHKSRTIIHEYVHTVVDKYLNANIKDLTPRQAKAVANIKKWHKEFFDKMKAEGKYDAMMEAYRSGTLSPSQANFEYAAYSEHEFMTLAMTSKTFQQELMSIKAGKKTLWEKLVDVLTKFFKAIGMEEAQGTRLEEVVGAFMTLSDFDMKINVENYAGENVKPALTEEPEAEPAITEEEGEAMLMDMLGLPQETVEKDVKEEKPKSGLSLGEATREREEDPDIDDDYGDSEFDDMFFSPKVGNYDELQEGANKTLRASKLLEQAKKLIADGRLEFDCKKQ